MKLDPFLLEILCHKVTSITEEAGFTIKRIGHTLFVKEVADFGTGLANLDGRFFAFPNAIGVSSFLDLDCGPTIRAVPDLKPGDTIITNHPYLSQGLATHTPDIHLVVPYFHRDRLVCFGWSFLHITDVSGKVPGSVSPSSTEIFQEGILIPPVKLTVGGKLNPDVLAFLNSNSRTPEDNLGDIKAMLAAHNVAQKRVGEVIEQHGLETFMDCQADLIEYAGLKAREVLRRLPNGTYDFWDYLDDDLLSRIPLRVRVRMTVDDGNVHLDYTGTDPQTAAAYNVVTGGKRHPWLMLRLMALVCTYDKSIPLNSGVFNSVTVEVPKGCVLNPEFPAAVGVRHATAMRVNDALHGALFKAAPDLVPAAMSGVTIPVVFAEPTREGGKRNVLVVQLMIGGTGGRSGLDGVDGRGSNLSNMSNNPIETVEGSAAIRIRHFGLRQDSGGAGRWRGGCGLHLTFEATVDGCSVLGRGMERFRFRPWGVAGGRPGAASRTILNHGRPGERELGKIDMVTLNAGDTFTVMTPGGGGYGDPYERDPALVLTDVVAGHVSAEAALRDYGVVVKGGAIDEAGTRSLRRDRTPPQDSFAFDENRLAWDAVFDDATLSGLSGMLQGLPAGSRRERQMRFLLDVAPDIGNGASISGALEDVAALKARVAEQSRKCGMA